MANKLEDNMTMNRVRITKADTGEWKAFNFTVMMKADDIGAFGEMIKAVQMQFNRVFVTGEPRIIFRYDTDNFGEPWWVAFGTVELTMPTTQDATEVARWIGGAVRAM